MTTLNNIKTILLALCCFFSTFLFSQASDYKPKELLVKWKPTSTTVQRIDLRTTIRANKIKELQSLDVEVWKLAADQTKDVISIIKEYHDHPAIEFIEPNYIYAANEFIPDDLKFDEQWNMSNTGQDEGTVGTDIAITNAWDIQRESPNVKIAIIDSGIDWTHPDLVDNIWQNLGEDADGDGKVLELTDTGWIFDPGDENGVDDDGNGYTDDFIGWDFINNDNNPYDDNAHGTHIAGIIGAKGNNGIGVAGITWDVQMAALKYLDIDGLGDTDDAVEVIDYAVAMGMDISNNSWGGIDYSSTLYTAIQNAASQNHLFIAAAGNDGYDIDMTPIYPASYNLDNIISVAAIDKDNKRSIFSNSRSSNYGAVSVDIAAPGSNILSCAPANSYIIGNGTSMAAPHVTGACALLLGKYPSKTYNSIKNEVLNTVDAVADLAGKTVSGGRLNVCKLLGGCENGTVSCSYRDSLVLVALYHATDGLEWDLSLPMSTWTGITISNKGCVTAIDLQNRLTGGSIPPEIGNLTNLLLLNLKANQLIGGIPTELGRLFNLQTLDLYNNKLTGNIPPEIGNMKNLRRISLYYNQLTGSLPKEIGNLRLLQWLEIYNNQLTDSIPKELGNLEYLKHLRLGGNKLTGNIPIELGNLQRLELLSLSGNQLAGALPTEIGSLINLQELYIGHNQLTGNIPASIGNLTYLQRLFLNDNELMGSIPTEMGNLKKLTYLSLINNELIGSIPAELGNLENIEQIYLTNNQLTGSMPAELGDLKRLQKIGISNNQLDGCFPQSFASFCAIDHYNFSNNPNLPNGGDFLPFCEIRDGICPCSRVTDSLTLVKLYIATNGLNWTNKWDLNAPIDTWHGVSINNNGCVSAIDLSNNQLAGVIPADIAHLTDLQNIELQNNDLSNCFPQTITSFCNINYNFSANSKLPNNGDLLAFCTNSAGSCISCNRLVDSLALVAIHEATNGNTWRSKWDLSTPINTWRGIRVNASGCVESISLGMNNLSGSIPPEIGHLNNLKTLNIGRNQLTSVSPEIGNLINLQTLELWENQLTDIPPEIGNLINLQTLNLRSNQLASIPVELGKLINLHTLGMSNNHLTSIPSELGNLTNLQLLWINHNQLTSVPSELGNLINLIGLDLDNNKLTSLPPELGNLINLRSLGLSINQLTNLPTELGNLISLEYLQVDNNRLTSIPIELGNLVNLIRFDIYSNQLMSIPTTIGNLSNLQYFDLSKNQLTEIITEIGNLAKLEELYLYSNRLVTLPADIGNLNNLEKLHLHNNRLIGSIPIAIENLTNLLDLRLDNNQLSGCFPENFRVFCNTITYNFSNNPNLPFGGDFDAFCDTGIGSCLDTDLVWPGDYNNDGIANNTDLLYWGLACKENPGPIRVNATNNWVAQFGSDWSIAVNNVNSKHQDGNGDGQIDRQDLDVLKANYGLRHETKLSAANFTEGVRYRIEPKGYQGGNTLKYDIHVSLNNEPISLHGVAFTIDFKNLPIANAYMEVSNSSINSNTDEYLSLFDSISNTLNVAITRTDKTNQETNGAVGACWVIIDNVGIGEPIELDVRLGRRMKADGNFKAVASTSIYDRYAEVSASSDNFLPIAYATHEECDMLGTAKIELAGGTAPYTVEWSTGETEITDETSHEITGLTAGNYSVTATDTNDKRKSYNIKIKRQYLPIYDENGDIVNCNPSPPCSTTRVFNTAIPAGTHQAETTITASGTIAASSTVTFKAGESITLQSGFTAVGGAKFLAMIEDCAPNTIHETSSLNPTRKLNTPSIIPNQLNIQIIPNPLQHQAMIKYELPDASGVHLVVSDMQGRQVKVVVDGVHHEAGEHTVAFIADDLTKGLYLVSLRTMDNIVTKKMVLLE